MVADDIEAPFTIATGSTLRSAFFVVARARARARVVVYRNERERERGRGMDIIHRTSQNIQRKTVQVFRVSKEISKRERPKEEEEEEEEEEEDKSSTRIKENEGGVR